MAGINLVARRRAIQASPTQGTYIKFADPEVKRLCIENFSTDGIGVTPEDAAAVTSIDYIFSGNTKIKSFDELKEFRITAVVGNSSSTGGAFKNSSIESLRLPNTVASIQPYAFFGCTALVSLGKLPSSITSIGQSAFQGCSVLSDIELSHALTSFGVAAFYKASALAIDIDEPNLTSIGNYAFAQSGIISITNLGKITALPDGASAGDRPGVFTNCKSLASVVLPNALTTIGAFAFYGDTALTTIDCDWSNITKINTYAFGGCTALQFDELNLLNLTTLGQNAFYNCTALEFDELNLQSLASLGQNALYGVKIKKLNLGALTTLPAGTTSTQNFGNKTILEEIVLSEDITTIPAYAFLGYKNLRGIVNHPNLTSIGACAYNTTSITRIENLGSITAILGGNTVEATFGNCASLSFVRLPATLTSIGRQAFYACKALETFICEAAVPPSLDSTAFSSTNSTFIIFVPDESVEAYKTATNWSSFASRIYPMSAYEEFIAGDIIQFADPAVEAICLANWDTNGSGLLSKREAKAVTSIGTKFKGNAEITSFDEFENFTGITRLGTTSWDNNYPFQNCTALTSIVLPESIKTIGVSTFSGCSALVNLEVKWDNIERLCEGSVSGLRAISGELVLPKLTTLDKGAFRGCPNITSLTLPAVTSIGQDALRQMTSLEKVVITGDVRSFPTSSYGWDSGVMYGCTALKFADLPATVTSAPSVFIGCSGLETVIFRSVSPPTITSSTFSGCSTLANIYVPDESVEAYRAATTWVDYAGKIKPLSEYTE